MIVKVRYLAILLISSFFYLSCSESETVLEPGLSVDDLNISLYKRPEGEVLLGRIKATYPTNVIKFSIVNQSLQNALVIDENTGEVNVKDFNLFDINEVEIIEADVRVTADDITRFARITVALELSEETISYFKEVALGYENGNSSEIVRKWKSTMRIFIDGEAPRTLISKMEETIENINELATDGFSVELVSNQSQSNCYIYFGTAAEFISLFPGTSIGSNFAIFNVWWNNNIINNARIFIDTDRTTITQQSSLILEEITQVLGIGKDSPRFRNSIFYETSNDGGFATRYASVDKEIVRLLYHPKMEIGINSTEVDILLRDILRTEW